MVHHVLYQPSIEIFGITVQEPVTCLTDLLISATCFIYYLKIDRLGRTNEVYTLFKYFFLFMSISTFIGGLIGHAFIYAFDFKWKLPGWIVSMISIMFMERAVIFHARQIMNPVAGRILSIINIVELVIFILLTIYTLNFYFVEVHAAYGFLLVVLPLELFVFLKTKDKGSLLMFVVIMLAILSAVIHIKKIVLHKWFNHLDLSHLVIMLSTILLYRAMQKMTILAKAQ